MRCPLPPPSVPLTLLLLAEMAAMSEAKINQLQRHWPSLKRRMIHHGCFAKLPRAQFNGGSRALSCIGHALALVLQFQKQLCCVALALLCAMNSCPCLLQYGTLLPQ
mmetsp:Transcript_114296/g.227439  ORF Transcript_114296/g.227439 Transcript_114296/m.227439 type:complete len:107 (-) Transcript_114296:846-1166(-)